MDYSPSLTRSFEDHDKRFIKDEILHERDDDSQSRSLVPTSKNGKPRSFVGPPSPHGSAALPLNTLASSRRKMKGPSFPIKLHIMLDEMEKLPWMKGIVSWQPHGRAFVVHNTYLFIKEANKQR